MANKAPMFNSALTLISTATGTDEYGNVTFEDETRTNVLCAPLSVTRSEFYSAAQAGLNPANVFEINGFEYGGESIVEFEGKQYSVIRSYQTDYETVQLTCERKAKDGGQFAVPAKRNI